MPPAPSKKLRTFVPLAVLAIAVLLVSMVIFAPGRDRASKQEETSTTTSSPVSETPSSTGETGETTTAAGDPAAPPAEEAEPPPVELSSLKGLHLEEYPWTADEPNSVLGSLDDPDTWSMQLTFTRDGAGIVSIPFADIWETAAARRQADMYYSALKAGDASGYELPVEERYVLQDAQPISWVGPDGSLQHRTISIFSAQSITIGEESTLDLTPPKVWKEVGPGHFTSRILSEGGDPVATIERRFELGSGYDITLHQTITNHTKGAIQFRWVQYGPGSLYPDRARYMDRRRFRFGYEYPEDQDPGHVADVIAGGDMVQEMTDATDLEESRFFWPNPLSEEGGYTLSWFASTNRYFGLAVHPILGPDGTGNRSLAPVVERIGKWIQGEGSDDPIVLCNLVSPLLTVPAGESHDLSMGLFAGPLERVMLDDEEPYKALNMRGLILFQMSAFCAICTFQWLADILVVVLAFLDHYVLFDWGLAIIGLVIIVRILLHPITKKSQTGMQRFTRTMSKLKPQMEKINQKHADDPKRKQQEQMKLMREHGVNPLQMLGCLPMFLQMPVWIALYAVLYFAFELRQEPAFFGVFQLFWDWAFLADLSSPDHFFYEFDTPRSFLLWNLTGINLLPILLGALFFVQQKYMSPPTTTMTPEQESQQKIMRIMMVTLFPLMLYSAPSGLTLYILTSSSVGILEARHIRRQVDLEDGDAPVVGRPSSSPKKKPKDPQARAYAKMLERRKAEAKQKKAKTFKKRK
ncbi:MAG: membrane protein insertase YidC [Planctomycetota bacterium]|nr:membrane protein insertase YidC [Planctomycetota bacterium]